MTAPLLASSSPANGATGVARNASLSVVFDQALDSASVDARSVQLRSTELNEIVPVALSLSADRLTAYLIPSTLLIPNSAYQIIVLGIDVDADHAIESDGDPLEVTLTISFQTGETITGSPSPIVGDLTFPEQVTVSGATSAPLRVVSASPSHHAFGISPTIDSIWIRFNKALSDDAVDYVEMLPTAFYEQDDLRAVLVDLGEGEGEQHYFRFQTGEYPLLDPTLFDDPEGAAEVSGEYLIWRFDGENPIPYNMALELTLGVGLPAEDGDTLAEGQIWFGCTKPWPKWDSLTGVRHEVGSVATASLTDDYVGMRLWRATVEILEMMCWRMSDMDSPGTTYRQYARFRAALDLWDDLRVALALAAGSTKRLGDLEIGYAPTAGAVKSRKVAELEKRLKDLENRIFGWDTQRPRVGIRGINDPYEPGRRFFRSRLWRAELAYRDVLTPEPFANTAAERYQTPDEQGIHKDPL